MWIKNSTIKACKEFVRLPNDEISDEIPRFASVQSNYSLRMELPIHGLYVRDSGLLQLWYISGN